MRALVTAFGINRESGLMSLVILGLMVLLGFAGIYRPYAARWEQLQREREEAQTMHGLRSEIVGYEAELTQMREQLSPTQELWWVAEQVERAAKSQHLTLTMVDGLAPRELGDFTKLSVRVTGTMGYQDFAAFLGRLEGGERWIGLDELTITGPSYDEQPRRGRASMSQVECVLSTLWLSPLGGAERAP